MSTIKSKEPASALQHVNAVFRVFSILERISESEEWTLEELSKAAGLAKPTAYRFLQTLQELGYVRRNGADRYSLTMKLFAVGSRALDHLDLYAAARPIAQALAAELGETVHMGVLDELEAVYVLKIESKYTIRMYSRVGRHVPLHCTSLGKCLLAWAEPRALSAILDELRLVAFAPKTIATRAGLEAELERVRRDGYALDDEEHEEGIHCVGAPIFDHSGVVVAAISTSWPEFRWLPIDSAGVGLRAARVVAAARQVSSMLGWDTDFQVSPLGKD